MTVTIDLSFLPLQGLTDPLRSNFTLLSNDMLSTFAAVQKALLEIHRGKMSSVQILITKNQVLKYAFLDPHHH